MSSKPETSLQVFDSVAPALAFNEYVRQSKSFPLCQHPEARASRCTASLVTGMTGPMFVGGGRGRGGGRGSGRGFGGGRGRGSGGRGGAPGGGGAKRPRSAADDELGENYDGFGGGGDAFANKAAMRNDKFDEYYTRQGVVPTAEWETMMASFRTPLPLTFRVNMSGKFRESTRHKLERDLFPKMRLEVPGMAPPKCLAWYPDRLAWQIDIPKDALKKSERLRELHAFMVRANEVGGSRAKKPSA